MIQLFALGLVLVAAGVLTLIAERLHHRRVLRARVAAELRRAAMFVWFWDDQDRRVQAMFAERAERVSS